MQKVELNKEAHENITELLQCITYSNVMNPDVSGIIMKEYDFQNSNCPTIELVMLVNDESFPLSEVRKLYGKQIKEVKKRYGVSVLITAALSSKFSFFPELDFDSLSRIEMIMRYVKCRDLMNSTVIYDKDGYYQELKERLIEAHKKDTISYDNLVEFVPPLKLERKNNHF